MFFFKKKITSNASRVFFSLKFKLNQIKKFKPLHFRLLSKKGRSLFFGKVSRTKRHSLKKSSLSSNITFRLLKSFYYVVSFTKIGIKSKVFILCKNDNGFFFYIPKILKTKLFNFGYLDLFNSYKFIYIKNIISCLYFITIKTNISYLESFFFKKSSYVRSNNTSAKFLNINKQLHTALIELPSKARKYFPLPSLCLNGSVEFVKRVKTMSTKSGFYRNFGVNTLSRGVAMNPVDHPNGGRTKALKCFKTPWGLVAKKK